MIAWINFISLIIGGILMTTLYLMSVRPAALEKRIEPKAYKRCGQYRILTTIVMIIMTGNYVLYHWFPLPIDPFPPVFPWSYWISATIALIIAIPSLYLVTRSVMDAKSEALLPDKSHTLYKGIYEKIRHPMAIGDLLFWWVFAFLIHSPFLVVFSFIWIPVWYWWTVAEERDLVLRYGEEYEEYRKRHEKI